VFTGLLYYDPSSNAPLEDVRRLPDTPLAQLDIGVLRPSRKAFDGILAGYR
jgi:hypothetical protein